MLEQARGTGDSKNLAHQKSNPASTPHTHGRLFGVFFFATLAIEEEEKQEVEVQNEGKEEEEEERKEVVLYLEIAIQTCQAFTGRLSDYR